MPECLLMAYAEEMPRIRALNVLDAAQAALYGQLVKTKRGGQKWWSEWTRRAQGSVRRASGNQNVRDVKAWLRSVLGGGFSE